MKKIILLVSLLFPLPALATETKPPQQVASNWILLKRNDNGVLTECWSFRGWVDSVEAHVVARPATSGRMLFIRSHNLTGYALGPDESPKAFFDKKIKKPGESFDTCEKFEQTMTQEQFQKLQKGDTVKVIKDYNDPTGWSLTTNQTFKVIRPFDEVWDKYFELGVELEWSSGPEPVTFLWGDPSYLDQVPEIIYEIYFDPELGCHFSRPKGSK